MSALATHRDLNSKFNESSSLKLPWEEDKHEIVNRNTTMMGCMHEKRICDTDQVRNNEITNNNILSSCSTVEINLLSEAVRA